MSREPDVTGSDDSAMVLATTSFGASGTKPTQRRPSSRASSSSAPATTSTGGGGGSSRYSYQKYGVGRVGAPAALYNNHYQSQQPLSTCSNCQGLGHMMRECPKPVCSYGVVLIRLRTNQTGNSDVEVCMVRRRDSFSFIEFVAGRYRLEDPRTVVDLLQSMTTAERELVACGNFDTVYRSVWQDPNRARTPAYFIGLARYCALVLGYELRPGVCVSLKSLLQSTATAFDEPEWGLPKGRPHPSETQETCAIREMAEETTVTSNDYTLIRMGRHDMSTVFCETFVGSNGVSYEHRYLMAVAESTAEPKVPPGSPEIGAVAWFTLKEAIEHMRPRDIEKQHMLERIFEWIASHMSKTLAIRDPTAGQPGQVQLQPTVLV